MSLSAQVRHAVQEIQPDLPVYELNTLEALADATLSPRTRMLTLLCLFAAVALMLACIGIYGMMAYGVSQRTREIGIRLALGAIARDVVQLVIRDGLTVVVIGLVIGTIGAGFATQLMHNQLFEVGRLDPMTYVAVGATFLLVGTMACLLPARRASKVDPMTSLRAE